MRRRYELAHYGKVWQIAVNYARTLAQSATLFFAYVGFDAVANAVEECRDPTRDVRYSTPPS